MSDRKREEILRANPRLPMVALPLDEAAASLGMSLKSFNRHVRPYIRLIRRKSVLLVPVKELERWADEHAEHLIPEAA